MAVQQPVDLFKGHPNHKLHPTEALKSASVAVLDNPDICRPALNYGPDEGFLPLRLTIAEWLSRHYQPTAEQNQQITPDRITITGGASQNLAIILSVFTDPNVTQAVWMISPTYFLACRIFDDAGFKKKLNSLSEDDEGVDVIWLEKELQKHESLNLDAAAEQGTVSIPCRSYLLTIPSLILKLSPSSPSLLFKELEGHQICPSLAENLQACHIWRSHFRQPFWQSDVYKTPRTACQAREKV